MFTLPTPSTLSTVLLGGRLGWAAVSDTIGTRNTFYLFTLGSVPLYLALPSIVENVIVTGGTMPLYAFCACTVSDRIVDYSV